MSLHPTLIVLATKILVHLRATWMYGKSRAVKLPENILSQIGQLGNHYPSPISKTTIYVNGPALVTHTLLYLVLDGHYLRILPLGLNHSAQQSRCSHKLPKVPLVCSMYYSPNCPKVSSIRHSREAILANAPLDFRLSALATTFALPGW